MKHLTTANKSTLTACVLLLAALDPAAGQSSDLNLTPNPGPTQEAPLYLAEPLPPATAGLLSEDAESDLASAATSYRRAIQDFDRQRADAANAIFRLGEVYRKMGRTEEAKVQYARILREFPDMTELTELSQSLLFSDETAPARRSSGWAVATEWNNMTLEGGGGFGPRSAAAALPGGVQSAPPNTPVQPPDAPAQTEATVAAPVMSNALRQRYGLPPIQTQTAPTSAGNRFQPATSRQADPQRLACISNLKQLGLASIMFAADHEGHFPEDVTAVRITIADPSLLVCPADNEHTAAPDWDSFDPTSNLSYDYTGVGATSDNPTTVLFRCPIHHHVVLGDGSVQQLQATAFQNRYGTGTADPSVVAPQMNEIMRKRYGLTTQIPQPALPTQAPTATVLTIPITISREGEVHFENAAVAPDELEHALRQRLDPLGSLDRAVVSLNADDAAPFTRVAAVLDACRAAGVHQVTVGSTAQDTIRAQIKRLEAQSADLSTLAAQNMEDRHNRAQQMGRIRSDIDRARTQTTLAQQRLQALNFPPESLPTLVSQDPRYQKLKAAYESAVLDGDEEARDKALVRLREWVDKIYRPELKAEVDLAGLQQAQRQSELDMMLSLQVERETESSERNQMLLDLEEEKERLRSLLK